MKKYYTILLCLFSVFFLFSGEVKAEDSITFSCDYKYGSGDSEIYIRVKVNDLSYEEIRSGQLISHIGDNDIQKKIETYLFNGTSMSETNTDWIVATDAYSKDYPSYSYYNKKIGILHGDTGNFTSSARDFLRKATASTKGISCPTMYIDFDTTNEKWINISSSSSDGSETMNLFQENCYSNGSEFTSCDLSEEVTSEDLRNPDILECEYSGNASWTFKLLYDKNNKTFTFDNNGSALKLVEMNEETLLSKFSSNECPSRIDCKCDALQQCYIYTNKTNTVCGVLKSTDGDKVDENSTNGQTPDIPDLDIYDEDMSCAEILGPNGVKVVKLGINILRIAGAIIALVNAMLSLLPAVMSKDADGLKKAGTKCVYMAIILALIFLFPTLLKIIGKMFEWDISCLV